MVTKIKEAGDLRKDGQACLRAKLGMGDSETNPLKYLNQPNRVAAGLNIVRCDLALCDTEEDSDNDITNIII